MHVPKTQYFIMNEYSYEIKDIYIVVRQERFPTVSSACVGSILCVASDPFTLSPVCVSSICVSWLMDFLYILLHARRASSSTGSALNSWLSKEKESSFLLRSEP